MREEESSFLGGIVVGILITLLGFIVFGMVGCGASEVVIETEIGVDGDVCYNHAVLHEVSEEADDRVINAAARACQAEGWRGCKVLRIQAVPRGNSCQKSYTEVWLHCTKKIEGARIGGLIYR
jgi:hypothetical protein